MSGRKSAGGKARDKFGRVLVQANKIHSRIPRLSVNVGEKNSYLPDPVLIESVGKRLTNKKLTNIKLS